MAGAGEYAVPHTRQRTAFHEPLPWLRQPFELCTRELLMGKHLDVAPLVMGRTQPSDAGKQHANDGRQKWRLRNVCW